MPAPLPAGALFADLSAGMAGGSGRVHSVARATPLPTITMVFARAEGGKQLMLRDKAEGAAANALLLAGLVSALRAVPGGYLCRVQDGEMKCAGRAEQQNGSCRACA